MIRWSANFAYAVGLIVTDGCLSKDGRHIDFTSKDLEQIKNFSKILKLTNKIGQKSAGSSNKKYFNIQFGNVRLYRFLLNIGVTPCKSKTIGAIKIPDRYFRDFLRGCLDGDGYNYSYWDPRWKSSFMFYTGFVSASKNYIYWLKEQIVRLYEIEGKISLGSRCYQLKYAKNHSIKLINNLYYKKGLICLGRKYLKIQQALGIIHKKAGVVEWQTR